MYRKVPLIRPPRHVASQLDFRQGAGIRSRLSSAVRCATTWRIRLDVLNCALFHPGLASIVYSSACVGSTSYFVVYAEVASQVENRQGRELERGRINGTSGYMRYVILITASRCTHLQQHVHTVKPCIKAAASMTFLVKFCRLLCETGFYTRQVFLCMSTLKPGLRVI